MAVNAQAIEDRASLGIGMLLLAWLFFSFVDTTAKWLAIAGVPAIQLAFMRYVTHFLASIALIARGGLSRDRFATSHFWIVLLRAFLLVSATTFNFYALKFLSLTVTSAIMFSSPIIVCLLAWPMLGERVGPWRAFAILLGFAGVLIIIRPFGETFHWTVLLVCYNACALALYSILTRKLAGVVATETMQFYMGLLGTAALAPFALLQWTPSASNFDLLLLWTLGIWAWAGHELLTRAHSFAPAITLMPYTYSFLIYLTIASYLVFGDLPDVWTMFGALVIVESGLIIWQRTKAR